MRHILIQVPVDLYKSVKKKAIDDDLSLKQIFIRFSELYITNKIDIKEVKNERVKN